MARLSVLVAQVGEYGEEGLLEDVDIISFAATVLKFLDLVGEHLGDKSDGQPKTKPC